MAINTLLVCDDPEIASQIQTLINGEQSLGLLETVQRDKTRQSIETLVPQLVWVEFGSFPVRGLATIAEMKQLFPHVMFLASHTAVDAELIRTAFRLKASDFLDHKTWADELGPCIKRLLSLPQLDNTGNGAVENKTGPLETLVICDADLKKRTAIEDLIMGQTSLTIADKASILSAIERVQKLQPALVWLELAPDPEKALKLVAELKNKFPKIPILVSYDVADPDLIRKSYRLGVLDFLDAERWRTDLPAAIAILQPGRKRRLMTSQVIWLAIVVAVGYLFMHGGHP
jgi:DNA-binding NarL/FixJ family response regulator